jgi:hypothetical protein
MSDKFSLLQAVVAKSNSPQGVNINNGVDVEMPFRMNDGLREASI